MPTVTFDYAPSHSNYTPEPPLEPPEDWSDVWDEEVDDIDDKFDRFLAGKRWQKLVKPNSKGMRYYNPPRKCGK